jgi:hypothetical protein
MLKHVSIGPELVDKVFAAEIRLARTLAFSPAAVQAVQDTESGAAVEKSAAHLRRIKDASGLDRFYHDTYGADSAADRAYFQEALKGNPNAGRADLNKVTGKPFAPVAAPVFEDAGNVSGGAVSIIDIGFLAELTQQATIGESGYATASSGWALCSSRSPSWSLSSSPDPSLRRSAWA